MNKTILLYGSDSWSLNVALSKKLDGSYTITNKSLHGHLPCISTVVKLRRLALAGHVSRLNEPAGLVLLWSPEVKRRVGRPYITIKTLLEKDTSLLGSELLPAMED